MNVYDTANRLAQEIKASEEYVNYKMAKETLSLKPELKKKIQEFEQARYEAQIIATLEFLDDLRRNNYKAFGFSKLEVYDRNPENSFYVGESYGICNFNSLFDNNLFNYKICF